MTLAIISGIVGFVLGVAALWVTAQIITKVIDRG